MASTMPKLGAQWPPRSLSLSTRAVRISVARISSWVGVRRLTSAGDCIWLRIFIGWGNWYWFAGAMLRKSTKMDYT